VALLHLSKWAGGFFCLVGDKLAAPGFAAEQIAQKAGYFSLTGARIEQSPMCARWKRMNQEAVALAL